MNTSEINKVKSAFLRNGYSWDDWKFEELVEWAEGYILKELIRGHFHDGVYMMVDWAVRWGQNNKIEESKKDESNY